MPHSQSRRQGSLADSFFMHTEPGVGRSPRLLGVWLAMLSLLSLGQPLLLAQPAAAPAEQNSSVVVDYSLNDTPDITPDIASASACATTGVSEDLTKIVPDFTSVQSEYTIAGGGGYMSTTQAMTQTATQGASPSNASSLAAPTLTVTQVRSTFAADLVRDNGTIAHVYGVKNVAVVAIVKDGKTDSSASCNWHLIGISTTKGDATIMAKSLSQFFAVLSASGNDATGFGKGAGNDAAAAQIMIAATTGELEASQTVSGNLSQSTFCAGIFTPSGGWAAYRACVATCFAGEHAANWAALMACLGIGGTAATAAAGLCAIGCLGAIPCVLACLSAVGIGTAGFSAGCLAGYAAACAGSAAGCAIGCW